MPNDSPPEIVVLERLKETCEMIRKHNANPAVARVALNWEARFLSQMEKLQPEAQADEAAVRA